MAAVSCCDWFSTTCFAQWALGASWACTPSTFLKRKWGGGNTRRRGEWVLYKQHRHGSEKYEVRLPRFYSLSGKQLKLSAIILPELNGILNTADNVKKIQRVKGIITSINPKKKTNSTCAVSVAEGTI